MKGGQSLDSIDKAGFLGRLSISLPHANFQTPGAESGDISGLTIIDVFHRRRLGDLLSGAEQESPCPDVPTTQYK